MPALSAGKRFGRFECLVPLGRGGMGTVWLARLFGAHGFKKLVALKTIHPELALDPTFRRMFLDEAMLVARLEHPNVVHVHELGEEDGLLYLSMEYVEGETLQTLGREAFRRDGVPLDVVLRIIVDAARGLDAAHELRGDDGTPLGVVHRDVSPHNLMIARNGTTKLLDFGVAKVTSRMSETTTTGVRKGRVAFMAPEQLNGGAVDRRADVFALGVVLYQLLTGKNPFRADTETATITNILLGEVEPPSTLAAVPPGIDDIVARCLKKKPEDRFATAGELATSLEALAEKSGLRLRPEAVSAWFEPLCGSACDERRKEIARAVEDSDAKGTPVIASTPPPAAKSRRGTVIAIGASAVLAAAIVATAMVRSSAAPAAPPPAPPPVETTALPEEPSEPLPVVTANVVAPTAAATPVATPPAKRIVRPSPRATVRRPSPRPPASDPLQSSGLR